MSDSLRPQFGDSMINLAPDVPENLVNTNNLSEYSYTFDQGLDETSGLEKDAHSYDLTNIIDLMLNDDITENDRAVLDLVRAKSFYESLRFYVKSKWTNLESEILPLLWKAQNM